MEKWVVSFFMEVIGMEWLWKYVNEHEYACIDVASRFMQRDWLTFSLFQRINVTFQIFS